MNALSREQLVALACFTLIVVVLTLWVRRRFARGRLLKRFRKARFVEDQAGKFLDDSGYRVLERRVPIRYALLVDGRETEFELQLDYVVERDGQQYVAEVKSGAVATSLSHAATRRQLIEYSLATSTEDVLLVDPERGSIAVVTVKAGRQSWSFLRLLALVGAYLLGALSGTAVVMWLCAP